MCRFSTQGQQVQICFFEHFTSGCCENSARADRETSKETIIGVRDGGLNWAVRSTKIRNSIESSTDRSGQ